MENIEIPKYTLSLRNEQVDNEYTKIFYNNEEVSIMPHSIGVIFLDGEFEESVVKLVSLNYIDQESKKDMEIDYIVLQNRNEFDLQSEHFKNTLGAVVQDMIINGHTTMSSDENNERPSII
jgi:hypothetical protein